MSSKMSAEGFSGRAHSIPLDILDDLASRFIVNAPQEERQDLIRMCFQVELAHWFYSDEYVSNGVSSGCSMREFSEHMFRHISFLRQHADNLDTVLEMWKQYKMRVPTYGAIILNQDLSKALLVQGYWSHSSWGFPKGKVNEAEDPEVCAIREVLEETGFDATTKLDHTQFLEATILDQTVRLYLVPGVEEDTKFETRTKCEIRDIRWFPVSDLPATKKDTPKGSGVTNMAGSRFFMVIPFIRGLRKWINLYKTGQIQFRPGNHSTRKRNARGSLSSKGSQKSQRKKSTSSETESHSKSLEGPRKILQRKSPDDIFKCPKIWSNFKLSREDIFAAMNSTPGWIKP